MKESRLTYLFHSYFTKTATSSERSELIELLAQAENDDQIKTLLDETWQLFNSKNQVFNTSQGEEMLASILFKGTSDKPVPVITKYRRSVNWLRIAAAAAVLFFTFTCLYLWLNRQPGQQIAQSIKISKMAGDIIVPGRNKAVLTLSDGSSTVLDSAFQGTLAKQGNAKVMKLNQATLAYIAGDKNNKEIVYNTLSTPNGGQYQLILPDGTKVWLNASSSIHFPTIFKGKERKVAVTGEAYFEVAKNAAMPFKVTVKDIEVQVLGTHFNIMAYDDESSMNTTLLNGSVKVTKGSLNKILAPGQQSMINKAGDMKVVEANLEETMAWKNGWFQFNAYDIKTVMRQISRWYDVEIIYDGKVPDAHFSGSVSRDNNISEVLKIVESAASVHFKIEGRKVVVLF